MKLESHRVLEVSQRYSMLDFGIGFPDIFDLDIKILGRAVSLFNISTPNVLLITVSDLGTQVSCAIDKWLHRAVKVIQRYIMTNAVTTGLALASLHLSSCVCVVSCLDMKHKGHPRTCNNN